MKTQQIPSEVFSNSYAIFISSKEAPLYQNHIDKKKLQEKGIGIIYRCKDPLTAAIVIPNKLDYKNIEKEFFDLFEKKDGFWGQYGLGYKGEHWTIYDN
jgi:hypothetical protein